MKLILDELNGIKTAVEFIRDADSFPLESVKNLKARLDRLALKTAHLIYRGRHDMDDPSSINPMVEVTLANDSGTVNGAVRDLGLAPEKANSWADFKKEIKTVVDMADSMTEIMSQAGMAVIDLGHDTSELPFCGVLAASVRDAGVPDELVAVVSQRDRWSYPEAVRV